MASVAIRLDKHARDLRQIVFSSSHRMCWYCSSHVVRMTFPLNSLEDCMRLNRPWWQWLTVRNNILQSTEETIFWKLSSSGCLQEMWKHKHKQSSCVCFQLQGSIMVGSLFQVFVGFSGLIGLFMRFIGPLTIAPTISLIGLSLFDSAGTSAGYHWGIAAMCVHLSSRIILVLCNIDATYY